MKKEVADLWVAALRSDDYQQTTRHLKNNEGYCCLGVLCEVSIKSGLSLRVKTIDADGDGEVAYDGDDVSLPGRVQEWAGVADGDPVVRWEGSTHSLSTLNDDHELSFNEIADLIEAQWEQMS